MGPTRPPPPGHGGRGDRGRHDDREEQPGGDEELPRRAARTRRNDHRDSHQRDLRERRSRTRGRRPDAQRQKGCRVPGRGRGVPSPSTAAMSMELRPLGEGEGGSIDLKASPQNTASRAARIRSTACLREAGRFSALRSRVTERMVPSHRDRTVIRARSRRTRDSDERVRTHPLACSAAPDRLHDDLGGGYARRTTQSVRTDKLTVTFRPSRSHSPGRHSIAVDLSGVALVVRARSSTISSKRRGGIRTRGPRERTPVLRMRRGRAGILRTCRSLGAATMARDGESG